MLSESRARDRWGDISEYGRMKRGNSCDPLNVTIRWAERVRSQTRDVLDSFFGPAELGDNLLIGYWWKGPKIGLVRAAHFH